MDGDRPNAKLTSQRKRAAWLDAPPRLHVVPIQCDPAGEARTETEAGLIHILTERGLVGAWDIDQAQRAARQLPVSLEQVLMARGIVTEAELLSAQAQLHDTMIVDLQAEPPSANIAWHFSAKDAIAASAIAWRAVGGGTVLVATTRPDLVREMHGHDTGNGRRYVPVLASQAQILDAQRAIYGATPRA